MQTERTGQQSCFQISTQLHWKLIYTQKYCTHMYRNFIHRCPKREATKMSFSKYLGKHIVVHPWMKFYLAIKKYELATSKKIWRNIEFILLPVGSQSGKFPYCAIPTIHHSFFTCLFFFFFIFFIVVQLQLSPSCKGRTIETVKTSV